VILGVILGPMMEEQFRRALIISDGDVSVFLTRPLTLSLLLLAAVALLLPQVPRIIGARRGRPAAKLTVGEED
jgi:putative tricarboxylic transport membrane protein